jgi:hypothetical protein
MIMDWKTLGIKELKRRAVFCIITTVCMSASLAWSSDLNPIDIASQTEKMGIVGVLVVVIVLQSIGLLYLLRLLGTKIIAIIEQNSKTTEKVIEAIEHCKAFKKGG